MEKLPGKQEVEEIKENPSQQTDYFNPEKLPLYLGIFAKDEEHPRVHEYIIKGLEQLVAAYQNDKTLTAAYEELKKGTSKFQLINDLHITSLYIGGNKAIRNTEYFKEFKLGHKMDIEIGGFVVVPGKIITGICYPDQSIIKVQNEFPHVTLMKGSWAPKLSNDLLQALCGKGCPLEKEYKNKEFITAKEFTFKDSVKVGKGQITAYVVKTPTNLILKGKTKAM